MSLISIDTQYDSKYTYFKGDYRLAEDGESSFFVVTVRETEFEKSIESVEWTDGAAPEVSEEEDDKIIKEILEQAQKELI